ncbi:hypothetical protein ES703_74445 [subsurface metagenome]
MFLTFLRSDVFPLFYPCDFFFQRGGLLVNLAYIRIAIIRRFNFLWDITVFCLNFLCTSGDLLEQVIY